MAHFFIAYKKREGHEIEVRGWEATEAAAKVIEEAQRRFQQRGGEGNGG